MSVAKLIVAISNALEKVPLGDPLPAKPIWQLREIEQRSQMARSGPVPAAARDWVDIARDRLRKELGEPVAGACVPVRLALRSALKCLGA